MLRKIGKFSLAAIFMLHTASASASREDTRTGSLVYRTYQNAHETAENSPSYENSWKMAEACFALALITKDEDTRKKITKQGITWSQKAVQEKPEHVEGIYFLATITAFSLKDDWSDAFSKLELVEKLARKANAINPDFRSGGPGRLLAGLYLHAPGWPFSIGNTDEAWKHLKTLSRTHPTFTGNRFLLIEALMKDDRRDEAITELRNTLSALESDKQNSLMSPYFQNRALELAKDLDLND